MNSNYLIPANSKRSQLILNWLKPIDLIILVSGALVTASLAFIFGSKATFVGLILMCIPLFVCVTLVLQVPNYHNVRQLLTNVFTFFFIRPRTYYWRGWCVDDEE